MAKEHLGISWKDRVTNEEAGVRTGQHSMDDILSERRLSWLGDVIHMVGIVGSPNAYTWTGVALEGSGI